MAGASTETEAARFQQCVRAFEEQFDYVYRLLRRMGVAEADVEDAVQDVFTILWRRWADYQPDRPMRPWLAGIAVRRAYKYVGRRQREVPTSEFHLAGLRADALEDRVDAQALLEQALARVPEINRQALMLHAVDGLPMPAVAELLAIPLATAYTRVGRGRRAFVAAARKLQRRQRRAGSALLPPVALLEAGRTPAPAPAALRERAVARARAHDRATPAGQATLDPWSGSAMPGWGTTAAPRPVTFGMAAAGLAAAGLLAFLLLGDPGTVGPRAGEQMRVGEAGAVAALVRPVDSRLAARPTFAPPTLVRAAGSGVDARELGRGISGYWRFDEAVGSSAASDLSGRGNDCLLKGVDTGNAWTEGTLGGALRVDNKGWISCPQPTTPAVASSEVTAALWMKRTAYRSYHQTLVARQLEGSRRYYYLFAVFRNALVVTSDVWRTRLEHPLPAADQWVHVAFTHARDGTSKLYIDGNEVPARRSLASASGSPIPADAQLMDHMSIGFAWRPGATWSQQGFRGQMDELTLYDRALSTQEIAALAGGTQPRL